MNGSTANGVAAARGAEGGRPTRALNNGLSASNDSIAKDNMNGFMDDEADLVSYDTNSRTRNYNMELNDR